MEVLDRITYRDYTIEILPDDDAENPFADWDDFPTLVLHRKAERHFGWSTDKDWVDQLEAALGQIREHGVVRSLSGPGGALDIISRWLRVAYGIPVVLHVSALEHSGVLPYLGTGAAFGDPGGWDSGWVGWLFATPEQVRKAELIDLAQIETSLRASFAEFAAWVSGDVVGYRIVDAAGTELTEMFGFYGSDCLREPDGWVLADCKALIDADIAERGTLHAVDADHRRS
jgi:hypothetical protein